ncbi:hypothetical protein TREES_T100015570 [Tupaia chinensis]|uniref:Uncharacterized protein n=1 Tax=Tupaia chinensis TaxID=246437 RepID=L9LAN1_TUPCH|nr:hypothetical protein TREES_T100015570 [Tupaia chinensis]
MPGELAHINLVDRDQQLGCSALLPKASGPADLTILEKANFDLCPLTLKLPASRVSRPALQEGCRAVMRRHTPASQKVLSKGLLGAEVRMFVTVPVHDRETEAHCCSEALRTCPPAVWTRGGDTPPGRGSNCKVKQSGMLVRATDPCGRSLKKMQEA